MTSHDMPYDSRIERVAIETNDITMYAFRRATYVRASDFGGSVQIDDTQSPTGAQTRRSAALDLQPLALRAVTLPTLQQRRRMPRRQIVVGCIFERRKADRRVRRPGIDGLLRMVLSDNWE